MEACKKKAAWATAKQALLVISMIVIAIAAWVAVWGGIAMLGMMIVERFSISDYTIRVCVLSLVAASIIVAIVWTIRESYRRNLAICKREEGG